MKPVRCGCGGEVWAFMTLYAENTERPYICQCRNCFTRTGGYPTEAEAVMAWNRAMGERTAKVIELDRRSETIMGWEGKCSNCGSYTIHEMDYCHGCGARLEWE